MPFEIKRKKTFGTVAVDHFSPQLGDGLPRAVDIDLRFEDGLKLHGDISDPDARSRDKRRKGTP